MRGKGILQPQTVFNAETMDGDLTSNVYETKYVDNLGLQVMWTSSDAVGTIEVQGSLNYDPHTATGDFEAITFDPVLDQPSSDNGSYLIDLNQWPFPYLRVFYDRASGTGSLTIYLFGKEV